MPKVCATSIQCSVDRSSEWGEVLRVARQEDRVSRLDRKRPADGWTRFRRRRTTLSAAGSGCGSRPRRPGAPPARRSPSRVDRSGPGPGALRRSPTGRPIPPRCAVPWAPAPRRSARQASRPRPGGSRRVPAGGSPALPGVPPRRGVGSWTSTMTECGHAPAPGSADHTSRTRWSVRGVDVPELKERPRFCGSPP